MAIVANKALVDGGVVDRPYCTFNRKGAGEPNGSITPQFLNELYLDSTNNALWKALDATNSGWVAMTEPDI